MRSSFSSNGGAGSFVKTYTGGSNPDQRSPACSVEPPGAFSLYTANSNPSPYPSLALNPPSLLALLASPKPC